MLAALLGALTALALGCSDGTIGSQAMVAYGSTSTTAPSGSDVTSGGAEPQAGSTTGAVAAVDGLPVAGETTTGSAATVSGVSVAGEATTGAGTTASAIATTGVVATTGAVTTTGEALPTVEAPAGDGVLQDLSGCVAPAGLGRPTTIGESVALLNALPKPTTPACYLAALERPIGLVATSSTRSAQPAGGDLSPRLFILEDQLVTSVVVAGEAATLIEYGEFVTPLASIKGELALPLTEAIDINEPFDQMSRRNGGTRCANCHGIELEPISTNYEGAFYSAAFRPNDGNRQNDIVALDVLMAEWGICDAAFEPTRCSMLEALFGRGEVVHQDFPAEVSTFQRGPDTIIDENGNVVTLVVDTSTTGAVDDTSTTTTDGGDGTGGTGGN